MMTQEQTAIGLVDQIKIVDELQRARLKTLIRACNDKVDSRRTRFGAWKWTNYWMSILGTILAGLAAATALTKSVPTTGSSPWWLINLAGLLALAATIVTGISTGVDPSARTVRLGIERGVWGALLSDIHAFTSDAAIGGGGSDSAAEQADYLGWFRQTLGNLEKRFSAQEEADARARKAAD